ncbi:MAG: hypothetical protein IIZ40_02000 [Bacilli bacterium]|nr:hypothetical protein [Bacilli bacterium]
MKLTLERFLDLYNFRNYRDDVKNESKRLDTNIIRIYLSDEIGNSTKWVEFGIYDYSEDEYKQDIYKEFINKDTLKKEIVDMYFDYDLNTFCITLKE